MIKAAWPTLQPNVLALDTREAILDLAPLLETLAERCGQPGVMRRLPYFLDPAITGKRVPCLILLLRPEEHQGRSLTAEDVEAAALFLEHRMFGLRTRALAGLEGYGVSSVIARSGDRMRTAAIAARYLIEHGSEVVLATYDGTDEPDPKAIFSGWPGVSSASRERPFRSLAPQSAGLKEQTVPVTDLVVRRRSFHAAALRLLSRFVPPSHEALELPKVLTDVLRDSSLKWTSGMQTSAKLHPVLGKAAPSERPA